VEEKNYQEVLRTAERELASLDVQAEHLERKRSTVRLSISVLQNMIGISARKDHTLTDAILTVVKAADGFANGPQVIDRLRTMGFPLDSAPLRASVATILSRLVKTGDLLRSVDHDEGRGYTWRGFVLHPSNHDVYNFEVNAAQAKIRQDQSSTHIPPK